MYVACDHCLARLLKIYQQAAAHNDPIAENDSKENR